MLRRSVPAYTMPGNATVRRQFEQRLTSSLIRHARRAGRDAVVDTAEQGIIRDAATKARYEGRVGYGRVLTGSENCAFCAMLASRGPVYKQDTVTRRWDGRAYHDSCDCIPVMVVEGKPWVGQEAEALYEQWKKVALDENGPLPEQFRLWSKYVLSGKLKPADYSPLSKSSKKGFLITNGVKLKRHERATLETLLQRGHTVELVPP